MANYTNEYSKLPQQVMERHYFKDVTNDVANLVNQIKTLQLEGDYERANRIIKGRPDLAQYMLSSEYVNAIDEETRNLEIMAKSKKQSIYCQHEEPGECIYSDVWIGDEDSIQ